MRRFQQVDVFASSGFAGNPLAVVLDADGVSSEDMSEFSRWTNLAETTFLLSPTDPNADYRVRIFSLGRELPFAGHPTLGTCHAWIEAGGEPKQPQLVVQECGAGLVRIRRSADGVLAFAAPPLIRSGPVTEADVHNVELVLRMDRSRFVDQQWADNGPGWIAVLLESADEVLSIEPLGSFGERIAIGVVGPHPAGADVAFEVRAFFTDEHGSIREDPVTGSLNASIAQWLLSTGRATAPYVASQGTRLGRRGRPMIDQDGDGTVWVGGETVTTITGTVRLSPHEHRD